MNRIIVRSATCSTQATFQQEIVIFHNKQHSAPNKLLQICRIAFILWTPYVLWFSAQLLICLWWSLLLWKLVPLSWVSCHVFGVSYIWIDFVGRQNYTIGLTGKSLKCVLSHYESSLFSHFWSWSRKALKFLPSQVAWSGWSRVQFPVWLQRELTW